MSERCVTHLHNFPTRYGDGEFTHRHEAGDKGYPADAPWCSVVEEEWNDRIDLDTMDCVWKPE